MTFDLLHQSAFCFFQAEKVGAQLPQGFAPLGFAKILRNVVEVFAETLSESTVHPAFFVAAFKLGCLPQAFSDPSKFHMRYFVCQWSLSENMPNVWKRTHCMRTKETMQGFLWEKPTKYQQKPSSPTLKKQFLNSPKSLFVDNDILILKVQVVTNVFLIAL